MFPIPVVIHGVQSLFTDAAEIHVPPVLHHLRQDVTAVDHRSGSLTQVVQGGLSSEHLAEPVGHWKQT